MGRFSTKPKLPSVWCSQSKTTVRRKFGSFRNGSAISNMPEAGSIIVQFKVKNDFKPALIDFYSA